MDLFDSIDKLLPLLFLFIWIVGLSTRGKRKTKSSAGTSSAPGSKPAKAPGPKPLPHGSGMGELKKTLRKVFEEIQAASAPPEMETVPFEHEEINPRPMAALPETTEKGESGESLETSARKKPLQAVQVPATVKSRQAISPAVVRNGFIWSEILAPPPWMR